MELVRQKAKDITNLLLDENRMSDQRNARANMRDKMNGGGGRDDGRREPDRSRTPPSRR
jgi:epsin